MKNLDRRQRRSPRDEVPRRAARAARGGRQLGRRPGHARRATSTRWPATRGRAADDTYWTGKGLGRAARIAEIADLVGRHRHSGQGAGGDQVARLTDWFTASPGETKHLFYYDKNWGTLIGYPAQLRLRQELNDHHFHYGYFIAAAATLAKFDPNWAKTSQYGGMVDLLIRDANNYDRADTRFPYLRDFDIYAGHDWASGHGSFAAGNNQESCSEGMNFAGALIQWGQATGNTAVRDAGIYIYTTQAAAIDDYWFDVDDTTFPSELRAQHGRHGLGRRRRVRHLVQRRAGEDPGHQPAADHRRPPLPGLESRRTTRPTTTRWSATPAASRRSGRTSSGSSWRSATATWR